MYSNEELEEIIEENQKIIDEQKAKGNVYCEECNEYKPKEICSNRAPDDCDYDEIWICNKCLKKYGVI